MSPNAKVRLKVSGMQNFVLLNFFEIVLENVKNSL